MNSKEYISFIFSRLFPVVKKSILHPGVMLKNLLRSIRYFMQLMSDELMDIYNKYPQKRYKQFSDFKIGNYRFDLPDLPSFLFQYKEIIQDEIYKFPVFSPQPVIIDIGANVGTSVLFFSKNYPDAKIFAYEADPDIFSYLEKNIQKNGIGNVQIFNRAVFDCEKELYFKSDGADGGSICLEDCGKKVKTKHICDILNQFEKIDLLKIDIEGAESVVIPAAKNNLAHVQNIFIEFHGEADGQEKLIEILSILKDSGFTCDLFNVSKPEQPFMIKTQHQRFSMQLEIFAYRA